MMRFSIDARMSRSLAALMAAILMLSAWLHAAPGHARDLPADYQILLEVGDHGLMVLPRETLEQRSREDDGSAGEPPADFDAGPSAAFEASTSFAVPPVGWHGRSAFADPATNPAAPRAPPFTLPL